MPQFFCSFIKLIFFQFCPVLKKFGHENFIILNTNVHVQRSIIYTIFCDCDLPMTLTSRFLISQLRGLKQIDQYFFLLNETINKDQRILQVMKINLVRNVFKYFLHGAQGHFLFMLVTGPKDSMWDWFRYTL